MNLRRHIAAALVGVMLGLLATMLAVMLAGLLGGCQNVTRVEFYEPTAANSAYCTAASDKSPGRGPLKSVEGKSGSPDFSDNKTFNLSFSFLGL